MAEEIAVAKVPEDGKCQGESAKGGRTGRRSPGKALACKVPRELPWTSRLANWLRQIACAKYVPLNGPMFDPTYVNCVT